MRKRLLAVLLAVGLTAGSAEVAAAGEPGLVRIDTGPIRGTVADGYQTYQGIPFAAPPVGELRWRPPQPVTPWTEPRDATKPAGPCAQPASGLNSQNEDCLYLNVTTPSGHGRKPVILWFHGGGNSYLSADIFGAKRLAVQGDVVVVTTNYRLGFFGFLAHPDLPDSGAFGLEDQQAAMRWVQRNAAAFGGDPENVTIYGESGGAYDVCAHLSAPGSRGLFQQAIAQSGGCSLAWPANGVINGFPAGSPFVSKAKAEADGVALATQLGCSTAACLRQLPASAFTAIDRGQTPVTYGTGVLPQHPAEALAEGQFAHVPVIWSNTRDEGRLTAATVPGDFTEDTYRNLLTQGYGADQAARIEAAYPSAAFGSPRLAYGAVLTDGTWVCHQLADERLLARRTTTFGFEFADRTAPLGFFASLVPPGFTMGAYHSSDAAYLFDLPTFDLDAAQQTVAGEMIGYWARLARTGDPNGPGLPAWPRFRLHDQQVQSVSTDGVTQVDDFAEHNCAFWSDIHPLA